MTDFIVAVDARTRLAGRNRLELLLFQLDGAQVYGINVFKVREVFQCPALTEVPHCHPAVRGIINLRGKTLAAIDLGMAIGLAPLARHASGLLVVTEYSGSLQGFLVRMVDRIVNRTWAEILPPPAVAGDHYLTSVTDLDGALVEILDVERILAEVVGIDTAMSEIQARRRAPAGRNLVLMADDSAMARKHTRLTLQQIGCETVEARDGEEALRLLEQWADTGAAELQRLALVISDIEMPRMDGYTLTSRLRAHATLKRLPIVLHTSLSGGFNRAMVEQVGADSFIAKFDADRLAAAVLEHLEAAAAAD